MHTVHAGLSIVAVLKEGRIKETKDFLLELNKNPGNNSLMPCTKIKSALFVSGVVIPAQDYNGETLPATVLLLTSFSGPLKIHLNELIQFGGAGLRELFQHSIDFPSGGLQSDGELKAFLKKHRQADAFYTGMQCITCTDVGREEGLRKEINDFIDRHVMVADMPPAQIYQTIQRHIRSLPDFAWAQEEVSKTLADCYQQYKKLPLLIVKIFGPIIFLFIINKWIAISAVFCILLFIIIILIIYCKAEINDEQVARKPEDSRVRKMALTQNHAVMNELTASGSLKKGWVRRLIYKAVIKTVGPVLGCINVPTIATARWMAVDKGKRLVFISNFANQAESYVRDFIDSPGSAGKINLLFGLGAGYPKTKWLYWDGATKDPDGFMNVFQRNQQVTQFWYWPYQNLSVDNININRKIRVGLFADFSTDEKILNWLSLL